MQFKYSDSFRDYKRGLYFDRNSEIYSDSVTNSLIKGDERFCYQKYNDPKYWFPNFYGSDSAYLNEWAFRIGSCIITFLELVDTSKYSLYF